MPNYYPLPSQEMPFLCGIRASTSLRLHPRRQLDQSSRFRSAHVRDRQTDTRTDGPLKLGNEIRPNNDASSDHTHTHTRLTALFSGTTRVNRYQNGKTNLDFTEARDSEWQRHQLGYMQVCISLQTDNHARTPPLSFSQDGCPSCRPTNSVKALKGCVFQPTDSNDIT